MSFIKSTFRHIVFSVLSVLGGVTLGAALVAASTTISTSITTAGGYTQSGSSENTFTGNTTLASTTATGLKVGQTGTRHTGMVSGSCTIASISVNASSTGMASCASATGVVSGDTVFVQAINTIPDNFLVQAASTTADTVIQIDLANIPTTTADSGPDTTGAISFKFWAVR